MVLYYLKYVGKERKGLRTLSKIMLKVLKIGFIDEHFGDLQVSRGWMDGEAVQELHLCSLMEERRPS